MIRPSLARTERRGAWFGFTPPRRLMSVFSLVIQVVVGVILFLVIGAAAVVLNVATTLCESHKFAPDWVIMGMRALEILIWTIDVVCSVLFMLREAYDFCRSILEQGR